MTVRPASQGSMAWAMVATVPESREAVGSSNKRTGAGLRAWASGDPLAFAGAEGQPALAQTGVEAVGPLGHQRTQSDRG